MRSGQFESGGGHSIKSALSPQYQIISSRELWTAYLRRLLHIEDERPVRVQTARDSIFRFEKLWNELSSTEFRLRTLYTPYCSPVGFSSRYLVSERFSFPPFLLRTLRRRWVMVRLACLWLLSDRRDTRVCWTMIPPLPFCSRCQKLFFYFVSSFCSSCVLKDFCRQLISFNVGSFKVDLQPRNTLSI